MTIETFPPPGLFEPIGPYSHIAQAGPFVFASGTPGVDPATGQLAGPDAYTQAAQTVRNLRTMLESAGCSLADVIHVNVYLKRVEDFAEMNGPMPKRSVHTALPARWSACPTCPRRAHCSP
jgi:2-iminobutanoate/2-iminopropanoate deaminase